MELIQVEVIDAQAGERLPAGLLHLIQAETPVPSGVWRHLRGDENLIAHQPGVARPTNVSGYLP